MLNAHISGLRAIPRFAKCRYRLIVECNLSGQGGAICDAALSKLQDADVVCSTNHTYGVFTVPGLKSVYFSRIRKMLASESIAFYETIVSACPYQASMTRQQLAATNLEKMEHQFRAFRYIYPTPSLVGMARGVYTGKADHENHYSTRMQDDLVMACGFGFKYAMDLLCEPPFARLRSRTLSNILY